jgi:hypothetical protein
MVKKSGGLTGSQRKQRDKKFAEKALEDEKKEKAEAKKKQAAKEKEDERRSRFMDAQPPATDPPENKKDKEGKKRKWPAERRFWPQLWGESEGWWAAWAHPLRMARLADCVIDTRGDSDDPNLIPRRIFYGQ